MRKIISHIISNRMIFLSLGIRLALNLPFICQIILSKVIIVFGLLRIGIFRLVESLKIQLAIILIKLQKEEHTLPSILANLQINSYIQGRFKNYHPFSHLLAVWSALFPQPFSSLRCIQVYHFNWKLPWTYFILKTSKT